MSICLLTSSSPPIPSMYSTGIAIAQVTAWPPPPPPPSVSSPTIPYLAHPPLPLSSLPLPVLTLVLPYCSGYHTAHFFPLSSPPPLTLTLPLPPPYTHLGFAIVQVTARPLLSSLARHLHVPAVVLHQVPLQVVKLDLSQNKERQYDHMAASRKLRARSFETTPFIPISE